MKLTYPGNWGMFLLALWLVLTGLSPFVHITFLNMNLVMAILALAAGIGLFLNR
jgi:hypothetical protein